jgi:hypothetical protein
LKITQYNHVGLNGPASKHQVNVAAANAIPAIPKAINGHASSRLSFFRLPMTP